MVFNKMAAKTIWKPDPKSVREMAIRMPDRPAFGWILYILLEIYTLPPSLLAQIYSRFAQRWSKLVSMFYAQLLWYRLLVKFETWLL